MDGVDCNYWKRIDTDNLSTSATCTTFKGFKIGADDLRAFVFASPSTDDVTNHKLDSGLNNTDHAPVSAGSVRVDVFECEPDSGIFMNRAKNYATPTGSQIKPDSKFYQQPSVTTTSGRNVNTKETFEPLVRWKNKTKLCSIVLYYHTKEVIDFFVDAQVNNIQLNTTATCGMKRPASSMVVDLTEDDDDDADDTCVSGTGTTGGDEGVNEEEKEEEEDNVSGGNKEDRNGNVNKQDDGDDGNEEDDDEIQHVPMVKHIPCYDISGDDAASSEEVSYIRKEY